jgi:hypothetical protein
MKRDGTINIMCSKFEDLTEQSDDGIILPKKQKSMFEKCLTNSMNLFNCFKSEPEISLKTGNKSEFSH